MMSTIFPWAQHHLAFIFFVYGLAFMTMGIAIWAAPKRNSALDVTEIMWLLAAFGIIHGAHEWLDMWAIIAGANAALDNVRWFALVASYFFLFEFGSRLMCLEHYVSPSMLQVFTCRVLRWYAPIVVVLILAVSIGVSDFWKNGAILSRYFLCFPGALLCGVGFVLHFRSDWDLLRRLKITLLPYAAAVAFLAYAVLGGLIVPKGDFFPSNWLNTESFLAVVGIQVEVFRALCAVVIGVSVCGMLRIFTWERR